VNGSSSKRFSSGHKEYEQVTNGNKTSSSQQQQPAAPGHTQEAYDIPVGKDNLAPQYVRTTIV